MQNRNKDAGYSVAGKNGTGRRRTHPFRETLDHQSDLQSRILDDRYRVLVGGVLEIRIVHGEDAVAHLQHVTAFRGTTRDDVLDEHSGYLAIATDVDLEEPF